jgi:hypothetical protein
MRGQNALNCDQLCITCPNAYLKPCSDQERPAASLECIILVQGWSEIAPRLAVTKVETLREIFMSCWGWYSTHRPQFFENEGALINQSAALWEYAKSQGQQDFRSILTSAHCARTIVIALLTYQIFKSLPAGPRYWGVTTGSIGSSLPW